MIKNSCGFDYETKDGIMYLRLNGEVDHHSASDLRRSVDNEICAVRPGRLVLDLSGVGFMDSSGLGFIMGRYALLRELGGGMLIRDPTPACNRILELAGIRRIIPVEYTEKEN